MTIRGFIILLCLFMGQNLFASSDLVSLTSDDLTGRWFKACEGGSVKTEDFALTKVALNEMFFLDRDCQRPSMIFISEGSYVLPSNGVIDFKFSAVKIRLMSESAVNDFNVRKVCGFLDWKLATDKEISGRPCEIFFVGLPQRIPAVGEMRYGIYQLDGNRLSLGKLTRDSNGTTPEKRPTELNPRFYTRMPHRRP